MSATETQKRTPETFRQELAQFSGSEEFFAYHMGGLRLTFTEGVRYLLEKREGVHYDGEHTCGGAWWLLDAIASWQPKVQRKAADGGAFQIWTLKIDELPSGERHARLACYYDLPGPITVGQLIEFTDFPLDEIKLYLEGGTVMLPSER